MGNALGLCPCDEKRPFSVLSLTESCVARLIREHKESGKKTPAEELNIPETVSEKHWMMKLKCLDDAHSNAYGLTGPAFYKLADQAERNMGPLKHFPCDGDAVIRCVKHHSCCPIQCRSAMEDYQDCIDTLRINELKEELKIALKEKRKEERCIVTRFLKEFGQEKEGKHEDDSYEYK